jgi:tRNA(fMet)-specific endonuclease VapC
MPYVVVDTCVVSYLYNEHTLADAYRPHVTGNTPAISFMTLAELYYGTLKRNWGEEQRSELMAHLDHDYFVIPFDRDLCLQWARVRNHSRSIGRKLRVPDAWIAATATLYGIPLVTHNRKHFEVVPGLRVVSEAP